MHTLEQSEGLRRTRMRYAQGKLVFRKEESSITLSRSPQKSQGENSLTFHLR